MIISAGEPTLPNFSWYLDTFKIQALTVPELFQVSTQHASLLTPRASILVRF